MKLINVQSISDKRIKTMKAVGTTVNVVTVKSQTQSYTNIEQCRLKFAFKP